MVRQAELIRQAQDGDKKARDKVVSDNLGLVHAIVRRFEKRGHDREELFQIGCIGLIKAINTFKAEKNNKLATYASRCIENEILMYFRARKKTAQDVYLYDPIDTDKDGNTVVVNAKSVILATGGFGANLDMVTQYKPELAGFMTTNAAGIQGQGIEMAQAIGAATVDMDQIQIHPTVEANTAALITEGLRGDGAVLINAEGKRFIDEVGTRDVVSAAEIAQTGSYSWLVVDQAMVDASSVIQGYIKKGYTVTGQTYEELAKAMGVDEAAFAETMKTWNGYVEAKNDPDFGRTSFAKALDTAPYYAIKVTAGVHHTMGGLKINTNTEVLKADGSVIPGLFAAGEVTGGVHGANRLGGNAVADFTVFGRIAGAAASKYAA